MLEQPGPLERLLAEVQRAERVVLLGDIVELVESRAANALTRARPILDAIGQRLGRDGEIVLVPGNHDRSLIRGWLRHSAHSLEPATVVPKDASPVLEQVVGWLGGKRVTVSYPGVWLGERIWATHGHYLDRHLIPVANWGRLRGRRGALPDDTGRAADYERLGRGPVGSLIRWLPGPVADGLDALGAYARATTMPAIQQGVLDPRFAPLTSTLLSLQMRRHALPALARVVRRLRVEAEWVVFGHVHRLGPLDGDDPAQWQGPEDGPMFVNTGSWMYEPRLVHRAAPPHPYWPGGAVVLEEGRPPRAVGLLDDLSF